MSKNKKEKEILFKQKLSKNRELTMYRKGNLFYVERIHGKNSMSVDSFTNPEEAYNFFETLVNNDETHIFNI